MIATLEHGPHTALPARSEREVFVRFATTGTSRVRANDWETATWLRRKLYERGWICTSPSPLGDWRDFRFFVTKGPATVRRNLRSELQSIPDLQLRLETD